MKTSPFKILILTVLSLISVAAGAQSFRNPVIGRSWPDPTVWSDGTRYYTISTGVGTILTSEDLVNWTDLKKAPLSAEASEAAKAVGRQFWAPDVVKIKDRWMLYLTCYESAENCGISVFESESATGPWEFVGKLTHSKDNGIKDSIDPEVVMDPESGKVWMFFGSVGGIHRVELTSDGKRLAEGARFEHIAGLNINMNPSRSRVYEGSYLYKKDGYWYLFASCGKYFNHTYGIVVGRSRTLDGTFTDKGGQDMADGHASAILQSSSKDKFFGPGHNGEIITDSKGQDYILYHCHNRVDDKDIGRHTLLQRIYWDKDGWPYFKTGKPLAVEKMPNTGH